MPGHSPMNERTFDPDHAYRLDDPERLMWLPPEEVLGKIPLRSGSVVADVGAGTGYFALPLSRAVGNNGRVFAVDFQDEMLKHLSKKLSDAGGPSNVEIIKGEASSTTLRTGSCDIAFMAHIWHELDSYSDVLRETRRVLRPGGVRAIVDWRPDMPSPPGPPVEHRLAAGTVQSTLLQSGWSVVRAENVGRYSYLIVASLL